MLEITREMRQTTLETYIPPLQGSLEHPKVVKALGKEQVATLGELTTRLTLAELTIEGAIELPKDAAPDAIAILPVLPNDDPTKWYFGESIRTSVTPALATKMQQASLVPATSRRALELLESQRKSLPQSPNAFGTVGGQNIISSMAVTNGKREWLVQAGVVIAVHATPGLARRGSILGHELVHYARSETRLHETHFSLDSIIQKCTEEVQAIRVEAEILKSVSLEEDTMENAEMKGTIYRARRVRRWENRANENDDPRLLVLPMLQHGYVSILASSINNLSPTDRAYLEV